jgi:hypothetical protein
MTIIFADIKLEVLKAALPVKNFVARLKPRPYRDLPRLQICFCQDSGLYITTCKSYKFVFFHTSQGTIASAWKLRSAFDGEGGGLAVGGFAGLGSGYGDAVAAGGYGADAFVVYLGEGAGVEG